VSEAATDALRTDPSPTLASVHEAAARIAPFVHRTPVLTSRAVDTWARRSVFLKAEHLQRVGAFKYRGSTNAVRALPAEVAERGVAAHSSGNHAQALALAARERGIPAFVVMPHGAPRCKRDATVDYGATVIQCEPTLSAREETLARVLDDTGATEIHPYDDPHVIAGAATAALELLEEVPDLDAVVAPVGGGGLLSGTGIAVHGTRSGIRVFGAEPAGADDAARSLSAGRLLPSIDPDTVADGLLTSLSARTFTLIRRHVAAIAVVPDPEIVEAMRVLWTRTKQVVEPSAAVAVAALRSDVVTGDRVGVILSGGNVDLDRLPF
jgi:threonine dehydratase